MKKFIMAAAAAMTVAMGAPAYAAGGNIFLTGHDPDYHNFAGLANEVAFVRNGSSLPVLVFDSNGSGSFQLDARLTAFGIPHTVVDPFTTTITDAMFDATLYSAFAVASAVSCGGCDLRPSDVASIAAHITAISAFFNAGGGILGLAAAGDPLGYAYVPEAASNPGGSPPAFGFVETAAGLANGLIAENGDATHNYFSTPGTGGLSAAYQIAEVNGDNVESIFIKGGSVICTGDRCVITGGVPESSTWMMMIAGFGVAGGAIRYRRRKTSVSFG